MVSSVLAPAHRRSPNASPMFPASPPETDPDEAPVPQGMPREAQARPADPEIVAALVPLFELLIQIDRRVRREERERARDGGPASGGNSPQHSQTEQSCHGAQAGA